MSPEIIIAVLLIVFLVILWYVYSAYTSNTVAAGSAPSAAIPTPISFNTCENDWSKLSFSCPSSQSIRVNDAKYGRYENATCMHPTASANKLCSGKDVTSVLGGLCNGKNSCKVDKPFNALFGDPCLNIYKNVTGSYTCV